MLFIESERLKILPLTNEHLKLLDSGRHILEQQLGLQVSNWEVMGLYKKEMADALQNFWLPRTAANAGQYFWYTNWEIIVKNLNLSVGGIGFAGEADKSGEVEIGYIIEGGQQNKGFATEALKLMCSWALAQEQVKAVIAHTYADNQPSVKTLHKCGFKLISKMNDDLLLFRLTK